MLGYFIIAVLFLFLLTPVSYLIWKSYSPVELRTIQFDKINTVSFLNIQDPVRINGVEIGSVRSINNKGRKTLVQVELFHPVNIYKGYRVIVAVKGLMGDRYLAIEPGDPGAELIDKNNFLDGEFQIGPTEAVAYAEKLCSEVHRLSLLIKDFKDGTATSISFVNRFNEAMNEFDTLSTTVTSISKELEKDLSGNLDSLSEFIIQTSLLTGKLSGSVPGIMTDIEDMIAKTDKLVMQVDTLISKSTDAASYMEGARLDELGNFIKKVRKNLASLHATINNIKSGGFQLPVRLW